MHRCSKGCLFHGEDLPSVVKSHTLLDGASLILHGNRQNTEGLEESNRDCNKNLYIPCNVAVAYVSFINRPMLRYDKHCGRADDRLFNNGLAPML